MKRIGNKGIALITVLIAVMFIGLLATSLSYMAYNNYITKSTRWSSENNFYYDEFALNELTCVMREQADKNANNAVAARQAEIDAGMAVDPLDALQENIKFLAATAGVVDSGDYHGNFDSVWVPATLQATLNSYGITNSAGAKVEVRVSVSTIPGRTNPTYERRKKKISFKNVQMTVIDKNNNNTTTITTDIVIPAEATSAKMKVNDFSLMSDQPLDWSKGGGMHFGGNLFCMDHAAAPHNGNAMTLGAGAQITIGGKKSLIVGNVEVKGNSKLYIYNETTITGTVNVESGSRVEFCGTNIKVGGVTGSGTVLGYYSVDSGLAGRANALFTGNNSDKYRHGLGAAITADVAIPTGTYVDGEGNTKLTYYVFKANSTEGEHISSLTALSKSIGGSDLEDMVGGSSVAGVYFRAVSDDTTGKDNRLMILPNNANKVRMNFINTTVIAPKGMTGHSADDTAMPFMTKMNDTDYNACLNTLVSKATNSASKGNLYASNACWVLGGSIASFESARTGGPGGTPRAGVIVEQMPSLEFEGKETRYMVYDTTTKYAYVPWGYFIRDDADEVIGVAFNEIRNNTNDGGEFNIVYENWVKE